MTDQSFPRIAFLGLGAMGSRMARRLHDAGRQITLWNRTPPDKAAWPGVSIAASPRDAADGADIVISMLRDDSAAEQVWLDAQFGALSAMKAGAIAIDCSTVSADWSRTLHHASAAAGIDCLDAPVIGSRPQAEAGALIFLLGGTAEAKAQVDPILSDMGSAAHHVGGPGSAATAKLIVNAVFGIQVTAIAELLGFAEAQGLDPSGIAAILADTPLASPALKGAMTGMLADAFAPMFPVDLVAKDFALAIDAGRKSGAPTPMTDMAATVFDGARAAVLGAENLTAVAKIYRRRV